MGFLGILEDKKLVHVPGTVILDEIDSDNASGKDGGKHTHIVLVPHPSDDPNDPLNWSPRKKLAAFLIIGLGTCLYSGANGGLLQSAMYTIAVDFDRSVGDIARLSGYQFLVAGATGPFVSAFAKKWGKRPVFLASAGFGVLGSVIGSATNSFEGLLACRIIQGGSTAAYQSLTISFVADIYFVHQRGSYVSMLTFAAGGVSNLVSVVVGLVSDRLGWKYIFHLCVAIFGAQLVLLFLFVPETQYRRDGSGYCCDDRDNDLGVGDSDTTISPSITLNNDYAQSRYNIDKIFDAGSFGGTKVSVSTSFASTTTTLNGDNQCATSDVEKTGDAAPRPPVRSPSTASSATSASSTSSTTKAKPVQPHRHHRPPPPKKTFYHNLALYTGTYSSTPTSTLLLAPFLLFATNAPILWAAIISALTTATYVSQALSITQIFSRAPYSLPTLSLGLLFLGPFAGALLGTLFFATTTDALIRRCARANGGVYEPEFRLLLMGAGLVSAAGLVAFGALCGARASVFATASVHAVCLFGDIGVSIAANAYVLDAYRDEASEIFVGNVMVANLVFYGASNIVEGWVEAQGPTVVFGLCGGLVAGLVFTTPVVFVLGKRGRGWWARRRAGWVEQREDE